jgi:hypothetical protein
LLSLIPGHPAIIETFSRWFPFLAGSPGGDFRVIFLLTLVPGVLSVVAIMTVVEKKRAPNHDIRLIGTLKSMPKDFRRFLIAVGIFGMAILRPPL